MLAVPTTAMAWDDLFMRVVGASALCSASIIEFTIPQVVKLSQTAAKGSVLPPNPLYPHRVMMAARMMPAQTAITAVQFALVRQLHAALDAAVGPTPVNLSLAYGAASVPLIAAKYNMIIAGVYKYNDMPAAGPAHTSFAQRAAWIWRRNVAPGLLWSFLRDSGSVGGAIVLAPVLTAKLAPDDGGASAGLRFGAGLLSGSICGLATQLFHNAALTAGRMAEAGEQPRNVEAMRRVLAEHGSRALYFNFRYRVAIIALWSGILAVTKPFARDPGDRW